MCSAAQRWDLISYSRRRNPVIGQERKRKRKRKSEQSWRYCSKFVVLSTPSPAVPSHIEKLSRVYFTPLIGCDALVSIAARGCPYLRRLDGLNSNVCKNSTLVHLCGLALVVKASCSKNTSVKALRCQLPRENAFYPYEPDDAEERKAAVGNQVGMSAKSSSVAQFR